MTEIFEGRVGAPFSATDLEQIYEEGRLRYAGEVPPGYKDSNKGEPGCFGDLVIWKEILKQGSELHCPIIFVTDDGKEDWWRIVRGQTVGPRVELVDEYFDASQARIHFYGPEQFLRLAKERVSAAVSDESIGEVEAVSRRESDDHLRAVVTARRDELLHTRDSMDRMLRSSEKTRIDEHQYRSIRELASALETRISNMRETEALLTAREGGLRTVGADPRNSEERAMLRREIEETSHERFAVRADIEAAMEEKGRSDALLRHRQIGLDTDAAERYRSRINEIDRDLSEVDQVLRELGPPGR